MKLELTVNIFIISRNTKKHDKKYLSVNKKDFLVVPQRKTKPSSMYKSSIYNKWLWNLEYV